MFTFYLLMFHQSWIMLFMNNIIIHVFYLLNKNQHGKFKQKSTYWLPNSDATKRNPVFKTHILLATGTVSKYFNRISVTYENEKNLENFSLFSPNFLLKCLQLTSTKKNATFFERARI